MTVAELISALRALPQDCRVVVPGYEFGYEDVEGVNRIRIRLDVNHERYAGPHGDADEEGPSVDAVLIASAR